MTDIFTPKDLGLERRRKTTDDLPAEQTALWGARLYSLCNLAWDYMDTIRDVCIAYRIGETRKLTHRLVALRKEYDEFRRHEIDPECELIETEQGQAFEEVYGRDFSRLSRALAEVTQGMPESERMLYKAVQMAYTLIRAVCLYARWGDAQLRKYGIETKRDYAMLQPEFLAAGRLVAQFRRPGWPRFDVMPFAKAIYCRLHIFGRIVKDDNK